MLALDRWLQETPILLEGASPDLKRQRLRRSLLWALLSLVASHLLCYLDVPAFLEIAEHQLKAPVLFLREHRARSVSSTALVRLDHSDVRAALISIILAPILWNGLARLEYHYRLWTRMTRGRSVFAHRLFSLFIIACSTIREYCIHRAVRTSSVWSLTHLHHGAEIARVLRFWGAFLYATGAVLSLSGFWRLRLYTYMPEYFGLFCSEMVSSFPFNVFSDPMYLGSALMHFGYALWCRSSTGLVLAVVLSLVYWVAARLIEEPFMYKLYEEEFRRRGMEQQREHLELSVDIIRSTTACVKMASVHASKKCT
jgi:phosphatidylethanolamine N-methyltransferase